MTTRRRLSEARSQRATPDTIDDYLAFRAALRAALRVGTPDALRSLLRSELAQASGPRDAELRRLARQPDATLEPVIRRLILQEPSLVDLHAGAREWLTHHGLAEPVRARIVPSDLRQSWPRPPRAS